MPAQSSIDRSEVEVVVIGGGPAGSTAAAILSAKGWRVLLLERERFPRPHVGESLLPASMAILEPLGVVPELERAGFLKKWGATMVWGTERTPWNWYFRETNGPYPHAYQVVRSEFDQILLENSRRRGVQVREGHRVTGVLMDGDRVSGVRFTSDDGTSGEIGSRFVVDASGQNAVVAGKLAARQWDDFFKNLAVYSYFRGANRLPEPDSTNIFIESYEHGWLWCIPLHTGDMSVGAVMDSAWAQSRLREVAPAGLLDEQVRLAPYTREMLAPAEMVSDAHVLKDWSYIATRMAGDGYVLAGDAACFIDPLFSSGVHLALNSGLLAAAYVATSLRDPGMRPAAAEAYTRQVTRKYGYFHMLARLFYSSNRTAESYFWEARRLSGDAWAGTPREAFINLVAGHPPDGYERVVVEQGHVPSELADGVRQVEHEKRERYERAAAALRAPSGIDAKASPALRRVVLVLADGVRVEPRLVVEQGEFVWGRAVVSAATPDGKPVIAPVAQLISLIDGRRNVSEIIMKMRASVPRQHHRELERSVLASVINLYAEGTVAELKGLS